MKYFLTILTVVWLLAACDDGDAEEPQDRGYGYFPLRVGMYAEYDVTEITYSSLEEPDTMIFQLRTEVVDSFANQGSSYTYVIHRFTRPTDGSGEWTFKETWSARMENEEAFVSQGNVAFVNLAFPLAKGLMWDGNKYNGLEEDQYEMTDIDVPTTVGEQVFQNTAIVIQEDYDDKVTRTDQRTEIYANGVGLIRKESTILNYCTEPICLNDQIIESGTYYKQEIREYGVQ